MPTVRPNRRAALGPVFADARTVDLAVQTVLRGPQDTSVTTGSNAQGDYVAVRIGRVLVYCYDEEAVAWHVAAWREATTRAARTFPDSHTAPPPAPAEQDSDSVGSAVLHVAGVLGRKLRSGKAGAVPVPFVQAQVGRLTSIVLDPAAVTSTLRTWQAAETAAETLFRDDPNNPTPREVAAFERRHPAEPGRP